jgi:hypothetical protein
MNTPFDRSYKSWTMQLQKLAAERDLEWIVSTKPNAHRTAYESGLSPEEELTALSDMGQWRGCGCGGA